jgi:uncharacterized protein (TIGR03382 family)
MARRAALLLLLPLLLPGVARPQTTTATLVSNPTQLSQAQCQQTSSSTITTVTWTWTPTGTTPATGDLYRFAAYAAGTACPTTAPIAGSTALVNADVTATASQASQSISISKIVTATSASCTSPTDSLLNICVYYVPAITSTSQVLWSGTLNVQTALPPMPVISSVTPGDSQLTTTVLAGTTHDNYQATGSGITYYVYCYGPTGTLVSTGGPGNASQSIVCSGLTNGTTYTVTAQGVSSAGNYGEVMPLSAGTQATPLPFEDFWNAYKGDGGQETGGCATSGAGALAPVAAVLALLGLRRRRS